MWLTVNESLSNLCSSPFWDTNLTWNSPDPDFTVCFEKTVLIWIPCLFLWLFLPLEIYYLRHTKAYNIPFNLYNIVKLVFIAILAASALTDIANYIFFDARHISVDIYSPVMKFLTFCLFFVLTYTNIKCGIRSSGVLFLFSFFLAFFGAPQFRTELRSRSYIFNLLHSSVDVQKVGNHEVVDFVSYVIYYPLVLTVLFLNCFADARPVVQIYPVDKNDCPENQSSFLSRIFFAWFDTLAWKGYQRPLKDEDLWNLEYGIKSAQIVRKFESKWYPNLERLKKRTADTPRVHYENQELLGNGVGRETVRIAQKSTKSTQTASIFRPLCEAFGPYFMFGVILKVFQDILTFVSPQILKLIIAFVANSEEYVWRGYFYAIALFTVATVQTLLLSQYFHVMFRTGLHTRTALVSVIYKKALKISNGARKDFTLGEIVNLMAVDAQRFVDLMTFINLIWSAPLQIFLAVYFLWALLGPSVLAGLAVMVILIPVNGLAASRVKTLQIKQMKNKDERVKLMNEILSGIKVLKLYAWEPSFEKQVVQIRDKEIKVLRDMAYLNAGLSFVWACAPFLVSLVTFAVYVLSDDKNVLSAETAFVSLSLFNILRFPLSMLPLLITNIVQTNVSVKRINKFLNSEELDPSAVSHDQRSEPIIVENGQFSWSGYDGSPTLSNIHMKVKPGSLVAVVGPVGSGKSSLLSAILGEMYKQSGFVNTTGNLAYVPQQAWIQNATFKDNVTFNDASNDSFYEKVVEACALSADLKILPAGDQTEIGEKGINLSGGQKQRISLARAVFADADTYLLDDPLSAVDSHVGKHIFEHVIGPHGLLKKKTRVLVTHNVTYLPQVDFIIVLHNGVVSESGTYNELVEKKGDFAEFLATYLKEDNNDSGAETDTEKKEDTPTRENVLRQRSRSSSETASTRSMNRQKSVSESESTKKKPEMVGQRLIETEKTETGTVKWKVYAYYLKAVGPFLVTITILMNVLFQAFSVLSNYWLSMWTSDPTAVVDGHQDIGKRNMYLGVYGLFGFGQAVGIVTQTVSVWVGMLKATNHIHRRLLGALFRWPTVAFDTMPVGRILHRFSYDLDVLDNFLPRNIMQLLRHTGVAQTVATYVMRMSCWKSSKFLHIQILRSILRVPLIFMDVTPIGRILSRFSKEIDTVDITLPDNFSVFFSCLGSVISTLFIISYSTPLFVTVIVPMGAIYYFVQRFYVATSRQLKRLESVSRSPIYSHFGETVSGVQSIRAYGLQSKFIQISEDKVDYNQKSYYTGIISNRWLSVRLEIVGNFVIFFSALFSVLGRNTLSAGLVGLSVSYALQITQTLNWLVRMTSEVETNIVAVERIKEYGEIEQEAPWELSDENVPSKWPTNGDISFEEFQVRYREGLDLVLKGITFQVKGGEKVGIVGRTGAGKSSLTLSLFRIIESAGGKILIDGVDISKIGLHTLRGRLTIIPQDPVLFSGTLRINLDPTEKYTDESIWRALELADLKAHVSTLNFGLQHAVTEGGDNFSVGQRQLICLARALLRKTKVLILDEATAAVDLETDDLIQATIRKEFKDCTVLTIAHRLNTIMDYDRIIVLDNGQVVEFDAPDTLLKSKQSVFYGMAADAGLV